MEVMAPETIQPDAIGAESSRTTCTWTHTPPGVTQQQRRHLLVHRDAAIVGTETMFQNAHYQTGCKAGSRKNTNQHATGYESIHIDVDDRQLTI